MEDEIGYPKFSCLESVSLSHPPVVELYGRTCPYAITDDQLVGGNSGKEIHDNDCLSKKMETGGDVSLKPNCSSKAEAAVLGLEQLLDRVRWMKRMLQSETSLSKPMPPIVRKFQGYCQDGDERAGFRD